MNATEADRIALSVFHSTIFIMGLPGNVLIIIVFSVSREFRSRASSTCLIIMTIADLITCICAVPYYTTGLLIERFDENTRMYTDLCKVTIFIITTAGIVRILTFTTMSVDRYVAVAYPYYYSNHCSRTKVLVLACIILIHAALSTLPTVVIDGWLIYNARNEAVCRFTSPPNSLVYTAPMVIVNFAAPTITVLVMNCKVFVIARQQLKRVVMEDGRYCNLCSHRENSSVANAKNEEQRQAWTAKAQVERLTLKAVTDQQTEIPEIRIGEAENIGLADNNENQSRLYKINDTKLSDVGITGLNDHKNSTSNSRKSMTLQANNTGQEQTRASIQSTTNLVPNRAGTFSWLKRQSSFFKEDPQIARCRHSTARKNSREIVIALSTIVLALAFIITWAPFVVTRLIITIWEETNSPRLQTYTSASTVINSGLNPILILLTRKEVRQILRRKVLGIRVAPE